MYVCLYSCYLLSLLLCSCDQWGKQIIVFSVLSFLDAECTQSCGQPTSSFSVQIIISHVSCFPFQVPRSPVPAWRAPSSRVRPSRGASGGCASSSDTSWSPRPSTGPCCVWWASTRCVWPWFTTTSQNHFRIFWVSRRAWGHKHT